MQKHLIKSIIDYYIFLLSVLNIPWKKVALDFIIRLFKMDEFNAICVVIDRLTKQQYYILCSDIINAWQTGNLWTIKLHYI